MSSSYGTSWADQWDYGGDPSPAPSSSGKRSGGGGGGKKSGGGVERTKAAAASGLRKVKEGTAQGFQWIKDKYQQKKAGKKHGEQRSSEIAGY
ncbi:hypothetical protein E2562_025780 [Oryza meyeriana var. granulata]|uniref:Uncharacterized protein n=1 Tax=Oryza meyeriana var. granulata TaxID=110450 RepID=A0A6G1CSX3_9ORYZ|nr:hypothetical protein E2562_025780 [Oryza meyeriana var. granulata]